MEPNAGSSGGRINPNLEISFDDVDDVVDGVDGAVSGDGDGDIFDIHKADYVGVDDDSKDLPSS